jgi:hypothetical protein
MNAVSALVAIALIVVFTAVNLFVPYALIVFGLGIGLAAFLGIPCGFITPGRTSECRLGYC